MPSILEPQSQPQHGRGLVSTASFPVERAGSAQITFEVGRSGASESMHPALQSAVKRVDVLDMPRPAHAFAGTQAHGFVVHRRFFGSGRHRRRAIRAKDGVGVEVWLENLADAIAGDHVQQKVGRRPGAVADDQDGYQVNAALLAQRPSPAFARCAARALPLARTQEEGLGGLDHAGGRWRLDRLGQLQEAMPPAKRRLGRHTQRDRSYPNDHTGPNSYGADYHGWTSVVLNDQPPIFGKSKRGSDTSDKRATSIFEEFRRNEANQLIAVAAIHKTLISVCAK